MAIFNSFLYVYQRVVFVSQDLWGVYSLKTTWFHHDGPEPPQPPRPGWWLQCGSLKLGEKISHGKGAMAAMDQKNQGQIYKWSHEIPWISMFIGFIEYPHCWNIDFLRTNQRCASLDASSCITINPIQSITSSGDVKIKYDWLCFSDGWYPRF